MSFNFLTIPISEQGNIDYNSDYARGMKYCQYPLCPNHLETHNRFLMKKVDEYVLCSSDCVMGFYELHRKETQELLQKKFYR